jgi:hypothetical protein
MFIIREIPVMYTIRAMRIEKTMTVKVTRQHLEFATLMFEVLFSCEEALFGLMWQDYFDNEHRNEQPRIVYDKTNDYYQQLSQEFTTNDVKNVWGYSTIATASTRITKLIDAGVVEKIGHGKFRKLKSAA